MVKISPDVIIKANKEDSAKAYYTCKQNGATITYNDVWKGFGIEGIEPEYGREVIQNESGMSAAYIAAEILCDNSEDEPGFFERHRGSIAIGALGTLILALTGGSVLLNNYMVDGKFCLDKVKFDYTGKSNSHINASTSETNNGNVSADLNASLNMTDYGEFNITQNAEINLTTYETLKGLLDGTQSSNVTANIIGNVAGPYSGHILGFVNGTSAGDITGKINGSVDADINGTIDGYFEGELDEIKNLTGWFNGMTWDGSGFQAYQGKVDMSQLSGNKTKFIGYFTNTTVSAKMKGKTDLNASLAYNGTIRAQVDAENNGTLEAMLNATLIAKEEGIIQGPIEALLNGNAYGRVIIDSKGNVKTEGHGNAKGTVNGDVSTTGKGNMDGSSYGSESGTGEFSSVAIYAAEAMLSLFGVGAMANWEKDRLKGYFTEKPKKIKEAKRLGRQYAGLQSDQKVIKHLLWDQNRIFEEQKKLLEELKTYKKEPVSAASDYTKKEPEQPKAEV